MWLIRFSFYSAGRHKLAGGDFSKETSSKNILEGFALAAAPSAAGFLAYGGSVLAGFLDGWARQGNQQDFWQLAISNHVFMSLAARLLVSQHSDRLDGLLA